MFVQQVAFISELVSVTVRSLLAFKADASFSGYA